MTTLAEIEAAAAALPRTQQKELLDWLAMRIQVGRDTVVERHSVLDIEPVSVGSVVKPLTRDDDLLSEMLESRS